MDAVFVGVLAATGGLAYNVWGFLKAWFSTRGTPEEERFDILRTIITVVPILVGAFIAGYLGQLTPNGFGDYVSVVIGGFGVGASINLLGIDSFFSTKSSAGKLLTMKK